MGLLGIKKSIDELRLDLEKIKMAMKETINLTDEEIDQIVASQMETRINRGMDEQTALDGVIRALRAEVRGEKLSPAATFDGYIIGDKGVRDITNKYRQSAQEAFTANKSQAIRDGLVDVDQSGKIIVLDSRDLVYGRPNPRKGMPLLPELVRTVYGIASKRPNGQPKIFRLTVRDKVATEDPLMFQPIIFRANIGSDGTEMELRHSNRTRYKPYNGKSMASIEQVLDSSILDGYVYKLNDLETAAQRCAADYNYFIVVAGDVLSIGEETPRGTTPISIWDDSLGPDEARTVWVPVHLKRYLDFGVGSRIIVTGRAREGQYRDQKIYTINADGIYALPEYKTDSGSILAKKTIEEEY